jgi:hypothetical protein
MSFLRGRCHVLFVSKALISEATCVETTYDIFSMGAIRMHAHFRKTLFTYINKNVVFIAHVIIDAIVYGAKLFQSSLKRRKALRLGDEDNVASELQIQNLDDVIEVPYEKVRECILT